MALRRQEVIWTLQARMMLDEAVSYIAQDSLSAAQRLLVFALDAAASLTTLSERGRRVPEVGDPNTRELFVQRYRLIYEVHRPKFTSWRFCTERATLRSGGVRPAVSLGVANEALHTTANTGPRLNA